MRNTNKYTRKDWPKEWVGIESQAMKNYRPFINRELPGFCGSFASAALVHYVIFKDRDFEFSMDELISAIKPKVDGRHFYLGTYPWDLTAGLAELLEDDNYKSKWHIISDPIVTKKLAQDNPYPVIVGTTKAFGSKYGNHWVLVYAYGYNDSGQLFYKAYDNHGKYNAVIPASQTMAAVWLERKG